MAEKSPVKRASGPVSPDPDKAGDNIAHLLAGLSSPVEATRVQARHKLVRIGEPTVPYLLQELAESRNHQARWEAAKALSEMANPPAVMGLVHALEDESFDVRWLASKGLIANGRSALRPLLQALVERPDSVWLQEGAHHVLKSYLDPALRQTLAPVLMALEGCAADLEVSKAAKCVLESLGQSEIGS